MRQLISVLTTVALLAVIPSKAQITHNPDPSDWDFFTTQLNVEGFDERLPVAIDAGYLKLLSDQSVALKTVPAQMRPSFENSFEIIIRLKIEESNSFRFMGEEYPSLDEIENDIESEEELQRREGHFRFLGEWYPSLDQMESSAFEGKGQAGYFQFMNEEFAPMPEELEFPNT